VRCTRECRQCGRESVTVFFFFYGCGQICSCLYAPIFHLCRHILPMLAYLPRPLSQQHLHGLSFAVQAGQQVVCRMRTWAKRRSTLWSSVTPVFEGFQGAVFNSLHIRINVTHLCCCSEHTPTRTATQTERRARTTHSGFNEQLEISPYQPCLQSGLKTKTTAPSIHHMIADTKPTPSNPMQFHSAYLCTAMPTMPTYIRRLSP
jgi:hypothetical protein